MNSLAKLVTLSLAAGGLALPAFAAEQERRPVCAVLPLDAGPGVHAGQAGLIANQYSVILGRTRRYDVLPRYEVNRVLHSRGFSRGKFAAALKPAVAAGRALNADYVVVGSVRKTETGFALSTSLISVNEARAAAAARSYHAGDFRAFSEESTLENVKLLLGMREFPGKTPPAKPPVEKPPAKEPPVAKTREPETVVALVPKKTPPPVAKPPEKKPPIVNRPVEKEPPRVKRPDRKPPVAPPREEVPDEPAEIAAITTVPKPPEITTKPPEIAAIAPPEIKPLPPLGTELEEKPPVTMAPRPPDPPRVKPRRPVKPKRTEKKRVRDLIIVPRGKEPEPPPPPKATPTKKVVPQQVASVKPPPKKTVPTKVAAVKPPPKKVAPKKPPAKARPKKIAPEKTVTMDSGAPEETSQFALVRRDLADAAREKLDIGIRFNHYIYQTEKDDFIGSIDTIESENQYIFEDPLLDGWWPNGLYLLWRFDPKFAVELTYTELRAITLSHGGRHTDGTVVAAGPILTAIRRFPNNTSFVPYAGLGLAFFVSTSVTGDNPWHNGFGGRDWASYNAWAEAGASPYPNGGYQRTFRVADELGYVLGLGLEKKLGDSWSADLNLRYTHVVFENTYTLSFYGNPSGNPRYSEWDLSNFNIGLGVKYSF
ncbi:hypothetical protein ACFLQU_03165 [Verrucomicrobiota bacterium]